MFFVSRPKCVNTVVNGEVGHFNYIFYVLSNSFNNLSLSFHKIKNNKGRAFENVTAFKILKGFFKFYPGIGIIVNGDLLFKFVKTDKKLV